MRLSDVQGNGKGKKLDEVFSNRQENRAERREAKSGKDDAVISRLSDDRLQAKLEKVAARYERLKKKVEARGGGQEQSTPSTTPTTPTGSTSSTSSSSNTSSTSSSSSTTATSTSTTKSNDISTLAKKYVEVYEKNSGVSLSKEQREAKVSEVAEFYSEGGRESRLQSLVAVF